MDPAKGGRAYRERIGVVLQSAGFEEEFTVRELMRLQARLYPRRYDPDDVIDLVGLSDKRTARVKTLSGGQRRRLDLGLGLVGVPELLFLDEPTTGFDPSARHRAWDLIDELRRLGTTILLTTHYIEEADRLADRLAVLRAGRLAAIGPPGELSRGGELASGGELSRGGEPSGGRPANVLRFRLPAGVTQADLPRLTAELRLADGAVEAMTTSPTRDAHDLTEWALRRGIELGTLTLTPPSLEDIYLRLVTEPADAH